MTLSRTTKGRVVTGFTREQIVQRAFTRGSSMSCVDFLVSMAVAQRVVADVRRYLAARGINLREYGAGLVVARPGNRWKGTYSVEVGLPGVRNHDPRMRSEGRERADLALAALRASVKPEDLVRSWTMPARS